MRAWLSMALLGAGCSQELDGGRLGNPYGVKAPAEPLTTPQRLDRIEQTATPKVDVLWVVDDSCSAEEQAKLGEHAPQLFAPLLAGAQDWHVGVVSTDVLDADLSGKLQCARGFRYLDTATVDPIGVFQEAVVLGSGGHFEEAGLQAAHLALAQPTRALQTWNRGFLRADAALHVIVLSDQDDSSEPYLSRDTFVDFLHHLKRDPKSTVTFSSIVGLGPDRCNNATTVAYPSPGYIEVTNRVGGVLANICDEDWAPIVDALAAQTLGLRREFFLSDVPVPGTLQVWVDEDGYARGGVAVDDPDLSDSAVGELCEATPYDACLPYVYKPERNAISFVGEPPTADTVVHLEYERLRAFDQGVDRE